MAGITVPSLAQHLPVAGSVLDILGTFKTCHCSQGTDLLVLDTVLMHGHVRAILWNTEEGTGRGRSDQALQRSDS